MFSVFRVIIVLVFKTIFFFCITNAEENYNGWRPISNEKVLGNLRRNFIKTPEIVHFSASWNPIVHSLENVGHFERSTNIKPQDINVELMNEGNHYNDQFLDRNSDSEYTTSSEVNKIDNPTNTRVRKAKNIVDESLANNIITRNNENKRNVINTNTQETKQKETNVTNSRSNEITYEVTEISETSEVNDLLETNQQKNQRNFFEPTTKPTIEENLTNKLFNILGNYNIRSNDDLTNYDVSRKKHNSNFPKHGYMYPPPRYNSQNHYPIDPLLAVFLSNYGYYLRGLYGFPGNYYNIYGYLASNNIHNNKPFGAYKIYSDTDSSH